jgi:hypothetical protein
MRILIVGVESAMTITKERVMTNGCNTALHTVLCIKDETKKR